MCASIFNPLITPENGSALVQISSAATDSAPILCVGSGISNLVL